MNPATRPVCEYGRSASVAGIVTGSVVIIFLFQISLFWSTLMIIVVRSNDYNKSKICHNYNEYMPHHDLIK